MNELESKYLIFKQELFAHLDEMLRQNPSLAFVYIHPTSRLSITPYTSVDHDLNLKRLHVLRERLAEVLVTAEEITRDEEIEDRKHQQRLSRLQSREAQKAPQSAGTATGQKVKSKN
jgi:hypothetical protein